MMILLAVFLFPILCMGMLRGDHVHLSADECDTSVIKTCPTSWLVAYFEANIVLPPGAFLDEHCDSILEFVDCAYAFYLSCPKIEHSTVPFRDYELVVDALLKLCDGSSQMRAEYETFVPCLNKEENGFRDILRKPFTAIKDLTGINTNYIQVELTDKESKETACQSLTTDVRKFMEAFSERCDVLIDVTFYETATRYFNGIESICSAAAVDMNVAPTTAKDRDDPDLTATTQGYHRNIMTAVTYVYNVSVNISSTRNTSCTMDWLHDFRLLNTSDIHSDLVNEVCRDLQTFSDCTQNKSEIELDEIVGQSGVPSVNFTSIYIELERLCEYSRYAQEYFIRDGAKYSEIDWNAYNCSSDPVLPHPIHWIAEQLSNSLMPYPKDLQGNCSELVTEMQSLLHYKAKCRARYFSLDGDASNPYRSYTDLLQVFEQLCNNETSLWKDYETYSPCIKRFEGFFMFIIDTANADLMSFTTYISNQKISFAEVRAARARICTMRAVYMPLVLNVVEGECGTYSAEFLRGFMDNFLQPIERYCPNGIPFLHKMFDMYGTYRLRLLENLPPRIPPW